jgi:hypothetical protein
MTNFVIGQTFDGIYPPEAAAWCNANNAHFEVVTADGAEVRTFVIVENAAPTQEELVKLYEDAVQAHLDETARSKGYDNTYTCLSYLSSTDEQWNREANTFNAWRDSVWRKCHEVLNDYVAGNIEQPTVGELIALLPVIDW